jgi:hypothetical protein
MSIQATTRFFAVVGAAAVSAIVLVGPALAQQPLTAGEGSPQADEAVISSGKTRAERKAETMQERRNGGLQTGGLGNYRTNMSQQTATAGSTKTRVERKAQTMQAIKQHQMTPAGEA